MISYSKSVWQFVGRGLEGSKKKSHSYELQAGELLLPWRLAKRCSRKIEEIQSKGKGSMRRTVWGILPRDTEREVSPVLNSSKGSLQKEIF